MDIKKRLAQYAPIRLKADLNHLTNDQKRIIHLLVEAGQEMDEPFWIQNYGKQEAVLASSANPDIRRYIQMSYGPWDRLQGNKPFIEGVGAKPVGANFYPQDMTPEEFEASAIGQPALKTPYTMVRRDDQGNLVAIPYHHFFREHNQRAADKLQQAAELAEAPGLKTYLALRAEALLTDNYRPSDSAWVAMKANTIDILIGPMEVEDRLLGIKTAYAASIFIKDWHRTNQLTQYVELLPRFQKQLSVSDAYKQEQPGLDSELAVYDVIYCSGNDKASIPSGICWPDDEEVQLRQGTRSLLPKNVMQARFEKIYVPLAELLIADDQRLYVTFEAYFNFVMLHELAHSIGIKQTITNKGTVKEALKEQYHVIEEGKANVLSLNMIGQLHEWGYVSKSDLRDLYVTSLVQLLYNGDSQQSIMWLNFFKELGAYSRDDQTGTYRVNLEHVQAAANALAERLLQIQGDGDYESARSFLDHYGCADEDLKHDDARIDDANLPLGLVVEQEYS